MCAFVVGQTPRHVEEKYSHFKASSAAAANAAESGPAFALTHHERRPQPIQSFLQKSCRDGRFRDFAVCTHLKLNI